MDTKLRHARRSQVLGLAAMIALLTLFVPGFAGVALAHHVVPVVLQIDCNGNVSYTVYDWTSDTGTDAQAHFRISWAANGSSTYTVLEN